MAYMSILLMEDFILDQSMDYTTSTVISTFFYFGSHEVNGCFYLMGLRWGMRKRNAEMQKYK